MALNRRSIVSHSGVSIVPFHWAHPHMMDLRSFERELFQKLPNYNEMLKAYSDTGLACTALLNGSVACCFGVYQFWPGAAEAWMLTSNLVETHAVALTRGARRYFNQVATELQLKRLQITVNSRNIVAIRWAEALKFEREALLRQYGPGGVDYFMYARIYK